MENISIQPQSSPKPEPGAPNLKKKGESTTIHPLSEHTPSIRKASAQSEKIPKGDPVPSERLKASASLSAISTAAISKKLTRKQLETLLTNWAEEPSDEGNRIEAKNRILSFLDNKESTTLALNGLQLRSLPDDLFCLDEETINRLENLDLSDNNLSSIPSLAGLTSLQILCLSHNQLTLIPRGSLPQNIVSFYAAHNGFTSFPDGLKGVSIQDLDLSYNQITSEKKSGFSADQLQKADFSHNQLSRLPTPITKQDIPLQELDISDNELAQLTKNPEFYKTWGPKALYIINVAYNLVAISEKTIDHLKSITRKAAKSLTTTTGQTHSPLVICTRPSPIEWKKLEDMITAIQKIKLFSEPKNLSAPPDLVNYAIFRELTVIGEALKEISDVTKYRLNKKLKTFPEQTQLAFFGLSKLRDDLIHVGTTFDTEATSNTISIICKNTEHFTQLLQELQEALPPDTSSASLLASEEVGAGAGSGLPKEWPDTTPSPFPISEPPTPSFKDLSTPKHSKSETSLPSIISSNDTPIPFSSRKFYESRDSIAATPAPPETFLSPPPHTKLFSTPLSTGSSSTNTTNEAISLQASSADLVHLTDDSTIFTSPINTPLTEEEITSSTRLFQTLEEKQKLGIPIIYTQAKQLQSFLEGKSLADLKKDDLLFSAVIGITISLGQMAKDVCPKSPEGELSPVERLLNSPKTWRQIAGMRDIYAHHYAKLDLNIVREDLQEILPILQKDLSFLDSLRSTPPESLDSAV